MCHCYLFVEAQIEPFNNTSTFFLCIVNILNNTVHCKLQYRLKFFSYIQSIALLAVNFQFIFASHFLHWKDLFPQLTLFECENGSECIKKSNRVKGFNGLPKKCHTQSLSKSDIKRKIYLFLNCLVCFWFSS